MRAVVLAVGIAGCGDRADQVPCHPVDGPQLVATTTDFAVGALAVLDLTTGSAEDLVAPTSADPLVVSSEGVLFQIDRSSADVVREYRPGCWAAPAREFALPPGTNAHDLELVDGELFITSYERAVLPVYSRGGERRDGVDLGALADPDGVPEADGLVVVEGELYVALQNLDRAEGWTGDGGKVVHLDASSREVVEVFDVGVNPRIHPHPHRPGALVVVTGKYFEPDGAVSILDLDTGELQVLATEAELGFDLGAYGEVDAMALVAGPGFELGDPSGMVCVDLDTGERVAGPTSAGWYVDAVAHEGLIWVASRSGFATVGTGDGLLPVDPRSCTPTGRAVELTLEPYSLAVWP